MSFLFGVLSGIVAIILLYVVRYLAGSLISRLLEGSPRSIAGTWSAEFWKDGESVKEIAKVRQVLGWVWGTIEGQTDEGLRTYKMRGNLRENIFTATYETVSPTVALFRGAFTLVLSINGQTLDGQLALWTDVAQTPQTSRYMWTRLSR